MKGEFIMTCIDFITGFKMEQEILSEIEQKLNRKLTDTEIEIARLAAKKGIFKGKNFENGNMFIEQFNKRNCW